MDMDLVSEFANYIRDIFANAPPSEQDRKLEAVLARFEDSAVRKAASSMLKLDVDSDSWPNEELAERMMRHVSFRAASENMLPAHCMMLSAAKRLR